MSNNIPNINPATYNDLYSMFNEIIRSYLTNNLFTTELMEVVKVNDDNTINIKSILKKKNTQDKIIENDKIIYNIKVLMIQGEKTSITFTTKAGDVGLYLSLKNNYSNYFVDSSNIETTNNILFTLANGVFIPLTINKITNTLIIKNGNSKIELDNGIINIDNETTNIKNDTINIENKDIDIKSSNNLNIQVNKNIDVKSTQGAEITLDSLVSIKNTSQSLFTILNTLLSTLLSLRTGPDPSSAAFVIDSTTQSSLNTLMNNLASLMK